MTIFACTGVVASSSEGPVSDCHSVSLSDEDALQQAKEWLLERDYSPADVAMIKMSYLIRDDSNFDTNYLSEFLVNAHGTMTRFLGFSDGCAMALVDVGEPLPPIRFVPAKK
jgi:hypothetical protein